MNKPSSLVNKKAPEIKGIDFSKSNYTIVYFYPRDNTPGCTIEAKDFTELLPEFKKLNTQIYGISKDSTESHSKFTEKHSLKIPLIADTDLKIQKKYHVWRLKKFMGKELMGTVRTTFLIDDKGKIIYSWENVRAKNHAEEVLKYINSYK